MLISVIIPTCHRPERLVRCLERLAAQPQTLKAGPFEVIVTDDSRDTAARDLVAKRFPWAKWTPGPRRGPASNRNHGARQATGDWLAFVDDDCEPEARWLSALAAAIGQDEVEIIEGRTISVPKTDHPFCESIENLCGGVFWSCNLTVRRETFAALGGFDEDFAEAGGEDMELAWRIRQRGCRSRFVPEAVVVHPTRHITWRQLWWRTWLLRWMLLYRLKTRQAPPLEAGPLRVSAYVVSQHLLERARVSLHFFTQFDRTCWRTRLFQVLWRWLTLPVMLPYLLRWEFRFRQQLAGRDRVASHRMPALAKP